MTATVLVIDDDEDLRLLARISLAGHGIEVLEAASGETALEMLATVDPPPEAIMLDVRLPGIDGYEVRRRLAADERLRDIPVLLFSAHLVLAADIPEDVPPFAGTVRKNAIAEDLSELMPPLMGR